MRVKKLEIVQFRNLQNFKIDFDSDSFTTVIVGRNGTGKSNILEAIIVIFKNLDLQTEPAFPFTIQYQIHEHVVSVEADPRKPRDKYVFYVDEQNVPRKEFFRKDEKGHYVYLPRYVFGYYSGDSNRMEELFNDHQQQFLKDLINGNPRPLRPFLFTRNIYGKFVMLAFLNEQARLTQENEGLDNLAFLEKDLGLPKLTFDSALFVLRRPLNKSKTNEGDPRFWYARGNMQGFLNNLYDMALAPLRLNHEPVELFQQGRQKRTEHLYLYLPNLNAVRELAYGYVTPQEFFKALESIYIYGILSDLRLYLKVKDGEENISFRELSEGEQQLIMVLGMLRFTKEKEALFLLDEPDTHLNPAWGMQYLTALDRVVEDDQSSHIIMTTHSPLVLASLKASEVRILNFDVTGGIRLEIPERDPVKMGYPEILTSNIFGLRSILNPQMTDLLDQKRDLEFKENRTAEEDQRLTELSVQVQEIDLSSTVRDPLYKPFIEAMREIEKQKDLDAPVLSLDEQAERKKLAISILRKLIAQQEKDK